MDYYFSGIKTIEIQFCAYILTERCNLAECQQSNYGILDKKNFNYILTLYLDDV